MNQSSIIAGTLLAAFVLFVAARGRLKAYTGVLWGATAAPKPTGGSGGESKSNTGGLPEIIPGSADAGNMFLDVVKAGGFF